MLQAKGRILSDDKNSRGLKPGEDFLAYKARVIDAKSTSFCAAKWYNATIWLGHGQTTSCHHPPGHKIPIKELQKNPSAIHNTEHKKLMRKYMQEGQRPHECEYCWKVEDIGKNNVSDRVYKTVLYKDADLDAAAQMPWNADVMLKTLEISFERTCNFACSYCNPAFSTSWVNDIKRLGPYQNIISDGRGHFTDTAPWAAGYEKEEDNPYIQAFWRWWESGLSENLEELRITGGEPLMAQSVWRLFDWFKANQDRGRQMRFAVNSNLVPKRDSTIARLIEASHHVPHLEIYTSNESLGAHADYIRDGMSYARWQQNLHDLVSQGNLKRLHIMATINSLCLPSLTEFMDDMLEFKREHGHGFGAMTLNILRFPSFQSAAILPKELKLLYRARLKEWHDTQLARDERDNENKLLYTEIERAHMERLIDYLEVIETPHHYTAEKDKLYNDFKNFYHQYDLRRGKNFRATFTPEMVAFYDSIDVALPEAVDVLRDGNGVSLKFEDRGKIDPATTDVGYVSDEVRT